MSNYSVRINGQLEKKVDENLEQNGFSSKSELIRTALQSYIEQNQVNHEVLTDEWLENAIEKAKAEAKEQISENELMGPEEFDNRIHQTRSEIEKLENELENLKKERANTQKKILRDVADESALHDIDERKENLKQDIEREQDNIRELKNLQKHAQRVKQEHQERLEKKENELIKRRVALPIARYMDNTVNSLAESLKQYAEIPATNIHRKIGAKIAKKLNYTSPANFGLHGVSQFGKTTFMNDSIPELFGLTGENESEEFPKK